MATVYNALIRKIRAQDLKEAVFDKNGDVKVETISTVEGYKDGTAILAYDIPVSKTLFNNPNFDLSVGDNIEDAFLNLRALIDSYTYTLPTLYDTVIKLSDTSYNILGLTQGTNVSDAIVALKNDIDAIIIPDIPEFDVDILTSNSVNVALGLTTGATVKDALIQLESNIDSLVNPIDTSIVISGNTKLDITDFTGTSQSDMNIFLNNKIDNSSDKWEQVSTSAYIKPKVLSGQTLSSGIILDKSRPLAWGSDIGPRIVSGTNYDDVTIYGNTNAVIKAGSNPGGYFAGATVGSNNYGLNFNQLGNVTTLDISTDYQKLNLVRDTDSEIYEANLYYDNGLGINMSKNGSIPTYNINLKNKDDQYIDLNYSTTTNVVTTRIQNSSETYIQMGGTYNNFSLYRTSNNYIKMNGGSPGGPASTEIRFDTNGYIYSNQYEFNIIESEGNHIKFDRGSDLSIKNTNTTTAEIVVDGSDTGSVRIYTGSKSFYFSGDLGFNTQGNPIGCGAFEASGSVIFSGISTTVPSTDAVDDWKVYYEDNGDGTGTLKIKVNP